MAARSSGATSCWLKLNRGRRHRLVGGAVAGLANGLGELVTGGAVTNYFDTRPPVAQTDVGRADSGDLFERALNAPRAMLTGHSLNRNLDSRTWPALQSAQQLYACRSSQEQRGSHMLLGDRDGRMAE